MSLNDETKKLANDVFAAIENEKRKAYHEGYTKGIMDWQKTSKMLDEWREAVRLKDAPSAMDSIPVAPVPCVRGIKMDTMKPLFLKLHEELTEFEFEIMQYMDTLDEKPEDVCLLLNENPQQHSFRIAEEGADVCTMVATILHAVGIEDKIRFDAQAHVNKHNHERGRN